MKIDQTKKDIKLHLTPEGSLGLLAYGDLALLAWRKIKASTAIKENNKPDSHG